MAGLMAGRMNGGAMPPGPEQPMAPEGGAPMSEEGPRATPEDTATYEGLLSNTLNIVYDESVAPGIAASFQGPTPVESLATFVSLAVGRAAYHSLENGENVTPEMAMAAAAQVSEDLGTEMAQAAGAQPLNDEQIQAVFLRSVELLADQRDDRQMTDEAGKGMMPPQGGQEAPQGPGGPPVPGMA